MFSTRTHVTYQQLTHTHLRTHGIESRKDKIDFPVLFARIFQQPFSNKEKTIIHVQQQQHTAPKQIHTNADHDRKEKPVCSHIIKHTLCVVPQHYWDQLCPFSLHFDSLRVTSHRVQKL